MGALDPGIVLTPVTSMMPAVAVVMPVPLLMVPPVMLVPDSVSVWPSSTCSAAGVGHGVVDQGHGAGDLDRRR